VYFVFKFTVVFFLNFNGCIPNQVVLLLIFCIVVLLFFLWKFYHRNQLLRVEVEHKNDKIEAMDQLCDHSLTEIIELCKNDPSFLVRFKSYYRDFYNQLIQKHPNLNTSDLKFCAMIFLGFSMKEILDFIFIGYRSVQTKKNRLRKKCNSLPILIFLLILHPYKF
jgi:hypothetical protein